MILDPSVVALLVSSIATCALLLYAVRWGLLILVRWDLRSGSSLQLALERRTYLLSTIAGHVFAFELASLFLLVHAADALAPLFTGAMCAAGTLQASPFGYPVLTLKLLDFVLVGLWLVVNHVDAQGYDYPLIRVKYALLAWLAPLLLLEAVLQVRYFGDLRPDLVTSCCGRVFERAGAGLAGDLAALPGGATAAASFGIVVAAVVAALAFRRTGRGGWVLAAFSAAAVPIGLAAVVAFLSPYVYELPTHHCPFCLLQPEYHFVGYPLYAALLGGGVTGMAVGALMPFRRVASLADALPRLQRRLASASAVLFASLLLIAGGIVVSSHLRW